MKQPLFKIYIYSHFFKIIRNSDGFGLSLLKEFCKPLAEFTTERDRYGNYVTECKRVFASRTKDDLEYRFHINLFNEFKEHCLRHGLTIEDKDITYVPIPQAEKLHHKTNITKIPKDYQVEIIDFTTKEIPDELLTTQHSILLAMPTGTGKTFTSLYSSVKINKRVMIVILPLYIDKWIGDVIENCGVDPKAIMTVQGSGQMKGLINLGVEDSLQSDYIIVSTRTYQMFLDAYEEDPQLCREEYGCSPEDICDILKVGTVIVDETHQYIHAIFKIMLYTNVSLFLALSATLESSQPLVQKVHRLMYPDGVRYDKLLMKKYIQVYSIEYDYSNFNSRKIRTVEFNRNSYSHTAYEKSIMRNYMNKESYLNLIYDISKLGYIDRRVPGQKLLIFASTVVFCGEIAKFIKDLNPELDVRTYTQEDSYDNIIKADICVSTIQSAGTALDIPNLTTIVNTVIITSSPVANLQSLGRLREIPGTDVKYYYLYCSSIPAHKKCDNYRKELFAPKAESIKNLKYHNLL